MTSDGTKNYAVVMGFTGVANNKANPLKAADVYKRQVSHCLRCCCLVFAPQRPLACHMAIFDRWMRIYMRLNADTVSYTHLDVYKRQT